MNVVAVELLQHADVGTAAEIWAVMQAAYRVEAELLEVAEFVPLQRTAARIAARASTFYGIRRRGVVAAAMELEEEADGAVNIGALVVAPEHFRQGFGRRLVDEALRLAGRRRVTVSTGSANSPAIRLYEQVGFVVTREWTTDDGIPMVTLARACGGAPSAIHVQ